MSKENKHVPQTDPKPEKGKDNEHGHKNVATGKPGRSHSSK